MQLSAPAKVNLSFQIKERRADGFHEIETIMAPISLADRLTIERAGDDDQIEFSCDDPSLPVGDDNLVVRAAKFSRERTVIRTGCTISLEITSSRESIIRLRNLAASDSATIWSGRSSKNLFS